MNVLLIGYGKMGQYLCRALAEAREVRELTVCDTSFPGNEFRDDIRFVRSTDGLRLADFDCAFVATPAASHADVLERLIRGGVRFIYTEKPAVLTQDEFERIRKIQGECKIVTGYILRQAEPLLAMKRILKQMGEEGFMPELCSVTYQKYLPAIAERRAMGDMGIYDEAVHVWDLLFNDLGFGRYPRTLLENRKEEDPDRPGRVLTAQMSYYLSLPTSGAFVRIASSFRAMEKKRAFFFTFRGKNGVHRFMELMFDKADNTDSLTVTESDGRVLYRVEAPSLQKLPRQISQVFRYFEDGQPGELSVFGEAGSIAEFLAEANHKR